MGVAGEGRAILVDGAPPRIERGPPGDLLRRESKDSLGAGVRRLQPAVGMHEHDALRQRRHNRAVPLLTRPQRVLGAATGTSRVRVAERGLRRSFPRLLKGPPPTDIPMVSLC